MRVARRAARGARVTRPTRARSPAALPARRAAVGACAPSARMWRASDAYCEPVMLFARGARGGARRRPRDGRACAGRGAAARWTRGPRRARARASRASALDRDGTAGSLTRSACPPSTTITSPACAGAARTAAMRPRLTRFPHVPHLFVPTPEMHRVAVPPASLRRVRRPLALLLLFAALALASCGGGDDKEDVQDLLDKAFSTSIKSANLKVDASVQLKGSPASSGPCGSAPPARSGPTAAGCRRSTSSSRSARTAAARPSPPASCRPATAPS